MTEPEYASLPWRKSRASHCQSHPPGERGSDGLPCFCSAAPLACGEDPAHASRPGRCAATMAASPLKEPRKMSQFWMSSNLIGAESKPAPNGGSAPKYTPK